MSDPKQSLEQLAEMLVNPETGDPYGANAFVPLDCEVLLAAAYGDGVTLDDVESEQDDNLSTLALKSWNHGQPTFSVHPHRIQAAIDTILKRQMAKAPTPKK